MAAIPFAHALINSLLPTSLHFTATEVINKGSLRKRLVAFAQQDPTKFTEMMPLIKQHGDMFATLEGISVGLDDIEPDYEKRNAIIDTADKKLRNTTNLTDRSNIYMQAQNDIKKISEHHAGDLGLMARSGGRGNVNQLMKTVATPVVVGDWDGKPVDLLIKRSYSEGLSPMEFWVAGAESRGQVIKGQLGTSDPGDMSKVMANTVNRQVVSVEDCGTKNGQRLSTKDSQIIGKFLARDQLAGKRNDEITQRLLDNTREPYVFVRSPMTCEAKDGICSYCQGVTPTGKRMSIGENAGLRSAQALSEPLTQMALSSKHGVALVEGASNIPRGMKGLRQFLEAPKSFLNKATLSTVKGVVTSIQAAPQGGSYIDVNHKQHYAPPNLKIKVSIGTQVHPGDSLTDGIPNPSEIVEYKGLGAGRKYLVDQVHAVYKESGVDVDKSNIEHVVVPHLNYLKVEHAPEDSGLLPGEIIKQNKVDALLRGRGEKVNLSDAEGKTLAENYLHHTAGTVVSPQMVNEFSSSGITKVNVLKDGDNFNLRPFMSSINRVPLFNDNWLNKLGHRYLKQTILEAAHGAEAAKTVGYAPIAAYVRGTTFGKGPDGKY